MATIRHEFYETDEKVTLSIFDKGVDATVAQIKFEDRKFSYTNGEKTLVLEPLKGQIDPNASDFTIGKVKVEIRFVKKAHGRWGGLVGDAPDPLSTFASAPQPTASAAAAAAKKHKNWDGITTKILASEKEKTTEEDPNSGGDAALNGFFQKIYKDADPDTQRAMMKSYSESGGTTLSTNWADISKGKTEVKPPQGSEWKQWAA